jgi:hypothetical protein
MELGLDVNSCLKVKEGFISFIGKDYRKQALSESRDFGVKTLAQIIDFLGEKSAKSQSLKQIITNSAKFFGT